MKSEKIRLYAIEMLLIISCICFLIFSEIFTKLVIATVLSVFMIVSNVLIKSDKLKGKYNRKITKLMILIAIIYLASIYVLGIYIGFYNATVKLSKWSIVNYIIPYIFIIISAESIRKTVLLKDSKKKTNVIILIITVLLDIAITTNIYSVTSLMDYFVLIGFVIFSSIANNLLYNYIIIKYRNSKAIIYYRIITSIYVYLIPIIPNIHILFETIIRIILPYIIYLILEENYSRKENVLAVKTRTKDIVITTIVLLISCALLMLVSCKFKYGALVIGSGSMTGTINKGDVIVYEATNKDIQIEDIIVFKNQDIRVIHRVIDKRDSGTGMRYYTKGDANSNEDEGYRTTDDIIGVVKFRIPYIGQMTLLLNDIFN